MNINNIFGKKFWAESLELPPVTEMAKQVGDIYHFTSVDAIEEMLRNGNGRLILKKPASKYLGYFSFTRDPNLTTLSVFKQHVRLKLNGDKMSEKYKFEPFAAGDYYVKTPGGDFEAEERIDSSKYKGEIDLTPYLEEIKIVPFEELKSWYGNNLNVLDKVQKAYQKIIDFAEEKNIPLKVAKGFTTGSHRRARINENTSDMTFEEGLKSLTKYFEDNKDVTPLPKITINDTDEDNSKMLLGRTAYYNPNDKEITLFVLGRHPKDVLRSFAHEMIHHIQNLRGDLKDAPDTTNTNEDDYLNKLEQEAYTDGNMTFRNWEDSLKN